MASAQYEEVQQWLIKSQRDLRVAQVLFDNEESLGISTGCSGLSLSVVC